MATQYGIDLGAALQQAETIKGMRNQNLLSNMKIDAAKGAGTQRNLLAGLKRRAMAGDKSALKDLAIEDTGAAVEFQKVYDPMNKREKEQVKANLLESSQKIGWIAEAPPEEQQERWTYVRDSMTPEQQANMPEQVDPNFIGTSLAKIRSLEEITKGVADSKKTKEGPGLTRADEGEMGKQITRLYGGFFDPTTGQFSGMQKGKEAEVQAIQTEAARMFKAGKADSIADAVTKAARKMGIKIKDLNPSSATDPANIRQYLQQ